MVTEKELIQACILNKQSAQNELYNKYKAKMYGLCLRYARNKEEAEDFLLEGFYKIFRDLRQYNFQSPLENWIRKIIINNALMTLRKKNILDFHSEDMEKIEIATDPEVWQQLEAETILNAIQQLPIGYQTIFNLFAIEGYSHKEIARKLSITESTSRSQYTRAKQALQKVLLKKI